jgi:uncharacterized membrane protein HdeD (DUF308 family)
LRFETARRGWFQIAEEIGNQTNQVQPGIPKRPHIPFWVTIARASLATFLGLALIIQPDKARPMLVNFMGMFWLASGIMSLRWGATGRSTRRIWPILAGAAGVIAGLMALSRNILSDLFSLQQLLYLLGSVMILTGVIHISGGFRIGKLERHRTWASIIIGVFEIVLGVMAIFTGSLEFSAVFYWALTLWALVGGFLLFADALAMRRQRR